MHENEFDINEPLVRNLLNQQFPEFADLKINQVKHAGTDNAIFRLGDDKCIRLPRIDYAALQIEKELKWLPKLVTHLPLAIPNPLVSGKPCKDFPYPWYIYNWIQGGDLYDTKPQNLIEIASDLAKFIKSLHKISADGAPVARRGLPLATKNDEVRKAILDLKDMVDPDIITSIWEECSNTPNWDKPAIWLHGDLLPSNLLIQNGKLNSVIDFGLMGIGDPACDLIPAWSLFDADSREVFRKELQIDDDTWIRGKGWALAIALIIIPYYLHTNPVLISVAKKIIGELIGDKNHDKK